MRGGAVSAATSPTPVNCPLLSLPASPSVHWFCRPFARILPSCSRRHVLIGTLLAATLPSFRGRAAPPPAPLPMEDPNLPGFINTDIGVRIQEVLEGKGPAASDGDMVEFNYVCRRSNGYFVYSTVDQFSGESRPVTLPLNGRKMIAGLQKVLVGMKPGGKRRAIIPPAVGYIDAGLEPQPKEFGPQRSLLSHAKEPLLFEVQLVKIRY